MGSLSLENRYCGKLVESSHLQLCTEVRITGRDGEALLGGRRRRAAGTGRLQLRQRAAAFGQRVLPPVAAGL